MFLSLSLSLSLSMTVGVRCLFSILLTKKVKYFLTRFCGMFISSFSSVTKAKSEFPALRAQVEKK